MRNRIAPYLEPPALPDRAGLTGLLWSGAAKALVVGDLYLQTDPERHDAAIAVGSNLAELATKLAECPPATTAKEHTALVAAVGQAMRGAESVLAQLAPQG